MLKKLKKLYYPDKMEVIKLYDSFLVHNGFSKNCISNFFIIGRECFQEYTYILGREMSFTDFKEYSKVKYFIKELSLNLNRPTKKDSSFDIFTEVKKYQDYLIVNREKWHPDFSEIFHKINKVFIILYNKNLKRRELHYLSHGDLHNKNILIDYENIIHLIDYDEVCYAPKDFDLIIFIFRFYKSRVKKLNSKSIKMILEEFENEKLNVEHLKLYIIKVILQKKYLEYSGRLLTDDILRDNWKGWYEDFLILNLHTR